MALVANLYTYKATNAFACNSFQYPGSRRRAKYCNCSRTPVVAEVNNNNKMKEERALLQKGIADFYDESSGLWEDIWGDHMHHGFYDTNALPSASDHRAAQIRMIEEALRFAGLSVGGVDFFLLFNSQFISYLFCM